MQSGRPKWIPAYAEREFDDGRKHTAKWLSLFQSGELLVTLTKAQFKERAAALAFAMPLGPSGFFQPSEAPSDDALEALWAALAGSAAADVLSAEDIEARLRALSEDGHSVQWGGFERTVAAAAAAL
ncbi:hypothetical protein JKP88DRAFT_218944 [Tribonema minus]|uniref:Uncharacterized protein n=1 Tax=Tribonema minus TaxID=303371 RepID=A0A835Z258_9STRA|nr:hypothetical protein JKP88DRAFT_218944 [Tribonema minus]